MSSQPPPAAGAPGSASSPSSHTWRQRDAQIGRRTPRSVASVVGVVLVILAVLVVAVVGGFAFVWWKWGSLGGIVVREGCTITTPGYEQRFDIDQAANAATIAAVGQRLGITERGIATGLATAMQESKIRNLDHGDRDSVGLFQQRPSQGWGTPEQIMNPVYASQRFFQALAKVPNYSTLPMAEAAQAVQRSADGSFYAQHEGEALELAEALTGRHQHAVSCRVKPQDVAQQQPGPNGLTPRANAVRQAMEEVFGSQSLGGYEPGGVSDGHGTNSAHYEGRAIDVFFRPISAANKEQGWELAHWLVAHAQSLSIATVIFDAYMWTSSGSANGWRPYSPAQTHPDPKINNVLRHLDHVHVDVVKGD